MRKKCNGGILMLQLVLAGIFMLTSLTQANDAPPDIEELLTQFNKENGIVESEGPSEEEIVEDYFGIKTYDKSRTQFDGVTHEVQVTYLKLDVENGVEIPIMSTGVTDVNIDFTVMMWFKIDKDFFTKSGPGGHQPQIMYLFSFEDSVACFFTDTLTLMCDSWDRRKLQIQADLILPGIWYHMTLSSSARGESYLRIMDSHHNEIAEDKVTNFGFRQNTMYSWKACLGDCAADYGFTGGIREFVLMERALTREEASIGKNMILTYNSDIKAYFRFQDIHNKFSKDEFIDWPWLAFKNMPLDETDYIGLDIIPNDVCPSLFHQISVLRHNEENQMQMFEIENDMKQNQYAYTMSVTLQVNETACTSLTPSEAERDCNLVEVEGVFMLYLMGRNTARFFFFANKNYYESVSQQIYIPYDQWITIQMTLEHYEGYSIVVADQNGNAFYRTRVSNNMQEQWPTKKVSLFRAFDGYVEHFYLSDSAKTLSPYQAVDFRDDKDALLNISFKQDNFADGTLTNHGREGRAILVEGARTFEDVFFHFQQEANNLGGTLLDKTQIFDGIACNDRHMTTHLDTEDSYINFTTPPLREWSSENTVEFWFKIEDYALYRQDALLFSMISSESNPQLYYHIYIEGGTLKCAPFGSRLFGAMSFKDPVITFTEFSAENADTYGWWHVSCSYAFQKSAKGTLYNTNVSQTQEETMIGLPKFYPTNSLVASFGKQLSDKEYVGPSGAAGVLVKEFRFWNKQLTAAELSNNRYRQVDPTKLDGELLLIYLRMATGSSLIENFAARSTNYSFDDFQLRQSGLSFVEDFIETEKYSYDKRLDLVVSARIRTYHTVCPVHTYYMKQYCYNEPVNKAILAIFPHWNEQSRALSWEMTLVHSSVINQEVIQFLTDSWRSDDPIVNDYFSKSTSRLDHRVPSSYLRHEAEYQITAQLSNDELTFLNQAQVQFIPSKCKWLTVVDQGVSEGYTILEVSPGMQEIKFTLELQRNPTLDCSAFDFFDAFSGIDFEFLMTDTADYISYIPKMDKRIYDPSTGEEFAIGSAPGEFMKIEVTMPAKEQERLPVFQDIMILMSAHWTSSAQAVSASLTEGIVFQNLLYTIKFEPTANVLNADLVASQTEIIREETLVLDAGSSFISNMPQGLQRRSLAFQWECPQPLDAFCQTRAGSQLVIPFSQVQKSEMNFEQPYEFQVTVIWAKPDGVDEKASVTVSATWFDLVMPAFDIDYDKSQTLITSSQNSLYYLEPLNFAADDIYEYDVEWSIFPELEDPANRSVLSGGRVMQIIKGSYSPNTEYEVTLKITHKKLAKLSSESKVAFQTLAPPQGGTVLISPETGFLGDEFTITLKDWTSANPPIEYNVYSTYAAGNRKGLLINVSGPIPVNEAFTFAAQRTTPIIVAVFDTSGETLEHSLSPEISLPPEPEPADSADGEDEDTPANDPSASDPVDGDDGEDLPSPLTLLVAVGDTESFAQRVNYMNVAIETVQRIDASKGLTNVNVDEQIEFRRQLLDVIDRQVVAFQESLRAGADPLRMPTRDFIVEAIQMLAQLTKSPQYLDQDIVDKCTMLIYRLVTMEDSIFNLMLEANEGGFLRTNYFAALENLSKFARLNSAERTLRWTRHQLEEAMDLMCSFVGLPEVYEYGSDLGELGFSLLKFDQKVAMTAKRGTLRALDASYKYNTYQMYNWFTASQPGELCAQVYAQQFGTVAMQGAYAGNSQSRLQVTIYEPGTSTRYTMGELSGQTIATFDVVRDTFHSNQTVCMGYSQTDERWQTDLCLSTLSVEDVTMSCTCNAFDSNLIGVFSDFTRAKGMPVNFPPPAIIVDDSSFSVIRSNVDPTMSVTNDRDDVVSRINNVNGSNFVWMIQTLLVAILTIAGAFMTHKMDKKDEAAQSLSRTSPIAVAKQNHFVDEIAKELEEPYGSVCLRKQSLLYYRTIYSKSAFPHMMSQLHPLLSPFTSYCAQQSRLQRYAIYMLQVNILSTFVYIYYSAIYRQNDKTRDANVIDSSDLLSLILCTIVCSFLLTPWLSEPLIKTCQNKLEASANPNTENIIQPVIVKPRRKGLRRTLIVCAIITTLALPIWAISASNVVPASDQYCMSTAVIGAIFGATLGTNLLYLWINSSLARKVAYAPNKRSRNVSQCIVHTRALQIVRDMKAVCEIKDQFTLADVLPSSLECSARDICSIHSGQHSQQHSNHNSISNGGSISAVDNIKLPPMGSVPHNKTITDELDNVEIIDGIDEQEDENNIMKHGIQKEEYVEEDKNELDTDQNEDSQRALNICLDQVPDREDEMSIIQNKVNESHKNLIASFLGKSMSDLDNSRNDVVPQRTQMEDEFASIHPADSDKSSSHLNQSNNSYHSSVHDASVNKRDKRKRQNDDLRAVANTPSFEQEEDDEAYLERVGRVDQCDPAKPEMPEHFEPKVIHQ